MSEKMCTCKACGQQIAKSAKTCPHCGAKNKKGNPILVGILCFVLLIIIVGAAGGNDEPTKVETNPPVPGQTTTTKPVETSNDHKNAFWVGETAELNKVAVSLVNVTESEGSTFNTPTEGNIFVLLEFEITNNSSQEIAVSSMLSFEAYCDDYACNFSLAALMEKGSKNQLDGTVAPGKKLNGVIGYEVPADWAEMEVHFTPNFWSGKDIVFIANND